MSQEFFVGFRVDTGADYRAITRARIIISTKRTFFLQADSMFAKYFHNLAAAYVNIKPFSNL